MAWTAFRQTPLEEQRPLLSEPPSASYGSLVEKGRCWACWEVTETLQDPLIRVCHGCLDKDLQYIHQECINRYVSTLNVPALRSSPPPSLRPTVPFSTENFNVDIFQFLEESGRIASRRVTPSLEPLSTSPTTTPHASNIPSPTSPTSPQLPSPTHSQGTGSNASGELHSPLEPTGLSATDGTIIFDRFRCSRCCDPYTVKLIPLHPLRVLFHDRFLFSAILLMTACVLLLTACCAGLLADEASNIADGGDGSRITLWFVSIRMIYFAIGMVIFCHSIYIFTWKMVWEACEGQSLKHVYPYGEGPRNPKDHFLSSSGSIDECDEANIV
ncbi:hypothetical protein DFS34DRAFT_589540 [Phlyctochytrium arcticum]|nr:hypothetical protein DFS34DRAFT_589540 [Phlyctochytrium arcticum]